MPYIWISAAVFALIIETASLKYTALCFLVSALGALVLSLAGLEIWIQTTVFIILTAVLVTLRYTVMRKFLGTVNGHGVDPMTLIGMQALVTQTIDNDENSGRVRLSGREWRAKANDGKIVFESGTRVTLIEYDPDFERFTCE